MEEGYFNDDGTQIDIASIPIPPLCLSCLKHQDGEVACNLTRLDQVDEIKSGGMFCCFAYEPNSPSINKDLTIKEMEEHLEDTNCNH